MSNQTKQELESIVTYIDKEKEILYIKPVKFDCFQDESYKIYPGNFLGLKIDQKIIVSYLIDNYNPSVYVASIIEESEIEKTHTLWGVEDGEVLNPIDLKNYSDIKKGILIESSSDDEDGTYPLVMHYVTLANKIDNEGVSAWLNRMGNYSKSKNRLDIDYNICRIIRENKDDSKAKLIFKKPIEVLLTTIGDKQIIEKVTEIQGEFILDWYWTKNGRQNKIANGFEIWFNIEKYLK